MIKLTAIIPIFTTLIAVRSTSADIPLEYAKFIRNTESEIILEAPFVHQMKDLENTPNEWTGNSACGPAVLTMLLQYHGEKYSLDDIVSTISTEVFRKGDRFYNLALGPEQYGYSSTNVDPTPTNIYESLKSGNPIIMNIQNYDGVTGHAIVIVGIRGYDGGSAKTLIVHDPHKSSYRTFEYINKWSLRQPEGYINPIGIIKPFYITRLLVS